MVEPLIHPTSLVASTLVDIVRHHAHTQPDAPAFIYLNQGECAATNPVCTYGSLDQQAKAIATVLHAHLTPGDRVLLVYPYDAALDFIIAFWGCLYAGMVAVPSHAPRNRYGVTDLRDRLLISGAAAVLTTSSLLPRLQRQLMSAHDHPSQPDRSSPLSWNKPLSSLQWWVSQAIATETEPDWQPPDLSPTTLAFLQFTSGSTGKPKGVRVTHGGLLHNQRLLQQAFNHTDQLVGMGWLPLFHDMGLIGTVCQTLYMGTSCVLMSPIDFIQKPIRWLQAISHYGATTSGGPNFAYDLLCRRTTTEQRQALDLSTWTVAFSGAEPVRTATLDTFAQQFELCGFRAEAFYPCYGMAEAILFIAGGMVGHPPMVITVDETALEQNQVAIASSHTPRQQSLISCGRPRLDDQVLIVDPVTRHPLPNGHVGEIWVGGRGLGDGYWQQPQLSQDTFEATVVWPDAEAAAATLAHSSFLRTGDLGAIYNDELFITGRLRDVLVFWGLNHYPQHIEQTVQQCHPSFRDNATAAFSIPVEGNPRLVVVQEVERRDRKRIQMDEVIEPIRWAVFDQHFVDVYAIALLPPGKLPKTPSGKVQRHACRDQFLAEKLPCIGTWRSPHHTDHDIPSMVERYFNPLVHVQRYWAYARQWFKYGRS